MAALQSHTTTGANHPAQFAAAVALGDDQVERDVTRMVAEFRKRRDVVVARFGKSSPASSFVEPLGAFYSSSASIRSERLRDGVLHPARDHHGAWRSCRARRSGDDRYAAVILRGVVDNIQKALDRIIGVREKTRRLELHRSLAQDLHAGRRHHAVVFDPHAELPELINPGLDREHHTGLETRLVAFDEVLGSWPSMPSPWPRRSCVKNGP